MSVRHIDDPQEEGSTRRITFDVKDDTGAALAGANIDTLTVTLTSADGTVINSRNNTDINGVNGGSVDASGNGVWQLTPADMALSAGVTRRLERRKATFTWTYTDANGTQTGRAVVTFDVRNLQMVS